MMTIDETYARCRRLDRKSWQDVSLRPSGNVVGAIAREKHDPVEFLLFGVSQ